MCCGIWVSFWGVCNTVVRSAWGCGVQLGTWGRRGHAVRQPDGTDGEVHEAKRWRSEYLIRSVCVSVCCAYVQASRGVEADRILVDERIASLPPV